MNRNKCFLTLLITSFMSMLLVAGVNAEEVDDKYLLDDVDVEFSADVAVYSKYIWRGFVLDNDPVMQSGAYVDGYGFNASIWGSFDIDSKDDLNSDEVDYSVGYSYDLKEKLNVPVSVSGGYIYYDFPSAKLNSQEFYIGLGADILLSPAVTWYHDFEDEVNGGGHGDYVVAELSHSIPISDLPITLDLNGHVGYNHKLFILGDGGDVGLGTGMVFQLSKNCTLNPNIAYSIPFGDLKKSDDGNQDKKFYGGAALALSF
ncbi:MAG: TorF family putative porin [Candidatus Orphnella occulta]|nr:TorF family putative porin [Candidatus Orphnella occulta]